MLPVRMRNTSFRTAPRAMHPANALAANGWGFAWLAGAL
jgi:hypothetical protein